MNTSFLLKMAHPLPWAEVIMSNANLFCKTVALTLVISMPMASRAIAMVFRAASMAFQGCMIIIIPPLGNKTSIFSDQRQPIRHTNYKRQFYNAEHIGGLMTALRLVYMSALFAALAGIHWSTEGHYYQTLIVQEGFRSG